MLDGDIFEYFDDDHNLTNGKKAVLRGESSTSFISKDCCFTLKNIFNVDGSPAEEWNILAGGETEMDDWVVAINGHIHEKFKKEHNVKTDYWEDADIVVSFVSTIILIFSGNERACM